MTIENETKSNYSLLYSWITSPSNFFKESTIKFNNLSNFKQLLALLFSYLLPLAFGSLLSLFLFKAPVYIIIGGYITPLILLIGGIALAIITGWILLLFNPGWWGKRFFNKQINLEAETKRIKKRKRVKGKILNRTTLFRRNLLILPLIAIFAAASFGLTNRTWNIYYLGFYLMLIFLTALIWMSIFLSCAASSMDLIFKGYINRKFININPEELDRIKPSRKLYLIQGAITLGIGILLHILLDLLFGAWVGAPNMPFWFKIAMVFLHGQ